jgi:hypothetical protein
MGCRNGLGEVLAKWIALGTRLPGQFLQPVQPTPVNPNHPVRPFHKNKTPTLSRKQMTEHSESKCYFCFKSKVQKNIRTDRLTSHLAKHSQEYFLDLNKNQEQLQNYRENKKTYIEGFLKSAPVHIYCLVCKKSQGTFIRGQDLEVFKALHDRPDCPCKLKFDTVILPLLSDQMTDKEIDKQIAALEKQIELLRLKKNINPLT